MDHFAKGKDGVRTISPVLGKQTSGAIRRSDGEDARRGFSEIVLPPELEDNHATLVQIYDQDGQTNIRRKTLSPEDKPTTPPRETNRRLDQSLAVVPSLREFQDNLAEFTDRSLSGLDATSDKWDKVVVAGSAVVASILPTPGGLQGRGDLAKVYHNTDTFAQEQNVDLFLYGLNGQKDVEAKITTLVKKIGSAIYYSSLSVVTEDAVTVVSERPTRHVRIFRTGYRTIAEILTSFDVDCSCVAYDGQRVYALTRAIDAYATRTNRLNLSYYLPGYEDRLLKYTRFGFGISCLNVDRTQLDPVRRPKLSALNLGLVKTDAI